MIVYLQFPGGPKAREMLSTEGDVRVDLDSDGRMVGIQVRGVTAFTVDDEHVAGEATCEAAAADG